ncbi:MAG: 8-amino-7-oxononanoate synthase [Cyclobacteriaceae bacterium]
MDEQFLAEKLQQRSIEGNLRTLSHAPHLKDFVSNDYLGLTHHPKLKEAHRRLFLDTNYHHGSTGSRLLSGNNEIVCELESDLAGLFESEACLLFNSGYVANLALVSAIAAKGDTILYDQLAHVCLKEGAWLSKAETYSFLHNDLEDLEARIKRANGRVFILTETIFSMDGDFGLIKEIIELAERYGCYLMVDEAHSTGSYGTNGNGWLAAKNLHHRVFGRVYTFGKAIGAHGACVAGSKLLIDYLINFARPFIYTTAPPPYAVAILKETFSFLKSEQDLQRQLQNKIALFRKNFKDSISETAIQPVIIGSNEKARKAALKLQNAGFDVRPILSPTVRKGSERLRISLHVHNSDEDIIQLCRQLDGLL